MDQEPIPCPPGTYNRNTKQNQCYQCDTGRYQTQYGMSFCNECPDYYQCPSRNLDPIPCPPNTYNANKNQDRCYPCSASEYQPLSGQTSYLLTSFSNAVIFLQNLRSLLGLNDNQNYNLTDRLLKKLFQLKSQNLSKIIIKPAQQQLYSLKGLEEGQLLSIIITYSLP
ncbi:hypothetical protein ABPG72_018076 [Tetrahymena utriculariae]